MSLELLIALSWALIMISAPIAAINGWKLISSPYDQRTKGQWAATFFYSFIIITGFSSVIVNNILFHLSK